MNYEYNKGEMEVGRDSFAPHSMDYYRRDSD